MEIEKVLEERGKTHGDFKFGSEVSQALKEIIAVSDADMADHQEEALDMICHKLARIVAGNPNEPDHWRDIAGYATLVVNILEGDKTRWFHSRLFTRLVSAWSVSRCVSSWCTIP